MPNHYYIGVPDINALRRTTDTWARRSELLGVNTDLDGQVIRIRDVCSSFEPEYRGNPYYKDAVSRGSGPGFGYIEAQALHGVVTFNWEMIRPATGEVLAVGLEFLQIDADGRITSDFQFIVS